MTDIDKSKVIDFRRTTFVTSAPDISKLPNDVGAEIAIIGRSNSGKSSSINAICDQKNLAKTSRTPGRTRLINLFKVNEGKYLVDLPGYGFSKMSKEEKVTSGRFIEEYLANRENIALIVLVLDIRHKPTEDDLLMYKFIASSNLPFMVVTNKADKMALVEALTLNFNWR